MRITIDVTKRDIASGTEDDCPITRAVRRALGLRKNSAIGRNLLVGISNIYFLHEDSWDETELASIPKIAQDFVHTFDREWPVEPFFFFANFNKARAKGIGLALPTA